MDRIRYFPPGRRCDFAPCTTILNHFNPGPLCLLHAEKAGSIRPLAFADPGLARLWVAIELTRLGMPNPGRVATASLR